MSTATKERPAPEPPKGCIEGKSPNGDKIWVKPPRGPGPWFRVKHRAWGGRLVRAKTAAEAVQKFCEEFSPAEATNKEWVERVAKECRIAKLPDPKTE